MEIKSEDNRTGEATIQRIVNGVIPRIGETITGISRNGGKVVDVVHDFSFGTVYITTSERG
jgi:hypothetical protein